MNDKATNFRESDLRPRNPKTGEHLEDDFNKATNIPETDLDYERKESYAQGWNDGAREQRIKTLDEAVDIVDAYIEASKDSDLGTAITHNIKAEILKLKK